MHMVISDFFHLRLGASVGGDQQHSYSLKVFIVFVALILPFPQVHLSVGGGGGGGGGGEWGLNRLPVYKECLKAHTSFNFEAILLVERAHARAYSQSGHQNRDLQ